MQGSVSFSEAPFEIIDGDRGKNYPKQSEFSEQGHCLFLSATNVTKTGFDFTACQFIDAEKDNALNKGKLQREDVVLTTRGTIGNSAYFNEEVPFSHLRINSGMVILRCDRSKLLPAFLYHFLRSPSFFTQVNGLRSGVAQPQLPIRDMRQIKMPMPALTVQKRVTDILSAYDELIENSQRRTKILESIACALYREWFSNFRFPGHKDHPHVSSTIGEIPLGWEVKKLGDLISLDKGVSYNGAGLTEDGNPMVNLKNILAGGGFRRNATKPYSGDFKPRHTVKPGDIVLANTDLTQAGRVVASPALIPNLDNSPILISHHLFAVRLPEKLPASFVYHLMLDERFRSFAKGYAIGTTVLGLPKDGILNFTFALPPDSLVVDFSRKVYSLHQLIENLLDRVDNLRRARDLLLPRLLSGQIDVEDIAA